MHLSDFNILLRECGIIDDDIKDESIKLSDIYIDSLDVISVLDKLEDKYRVVLDIHNYKSNYTVAEFLDLVNSKLNENV